MTFNWNTSNLQNMCNFFVWLKLDIPGREGAEITTLTIANNTAKDLQGHILFWTSIELFLKKITSTLYVLMYIQ